MSRFLRLLLFCGVWLGNDPGGFGYLGNLRFYRDGNGYWQSICASVTTGHVVCAVRTGKAAIMVDELNGTTWNGWQTLGHDGQLGSKLYQRWWRHGNLRGHGHYG